MVEGLQAKSLKIIVIVSQVALWYESKKGEKTAANK